MSKKELAIEVLASNPGMAEVWVTVDGQAFGRKGLAINHNTSKGVNHNNEMPEHFVADKLAKEVAAKREQIAVDAEAAQKYAADQAEKVNIAKSAAASVLAAGAKEFEVAKSKGK